MTSLQPINVYEAKTNLSKLIDRALAGEDVVIARAGKPIARLVPASTRTKPRTPGAWRGQGWIAEDFDETSEELIAAFHGDVDP